jgi:hypothetical protein
MYYDAVGIFTIWHLMGAEHFELVSQIDSYRFGGMDHLTSCASRGKNFAIGQHVKTGHRALSPSCPMGMAV